jgi:hypothetical protein
MTEVDLLVSGPGPLCVPATDFPNESANIPNRRAGAKAVDGRAILLLVSAFGGGEAGSSQIHELRKHPSDTARPAWPGRLSNRILLSLERRGFS